MEDLDAATLDDVAAFFRTFYVPNNAVLTVAGDFDLTRVMDQVERWFGEIPAGRAHPADPRPRPRSRPCSGRPFGTTWSATCRCPG